MRSRNRRPSDEFRHGLSQRRGGQGDESPRTALCGQQAEQPAGQSDWEDAAEACGEAIRIAEEYGYDLVPGSEWSSNFWGAAYTNEHIWAWNYRKRLLPDGCLVGGLRLSAGEFLQIQRRVPTQNCVDLFEDRLGDPLETECRASGRRSPRDTTTNRTPTRTATRVWI